jgi:biotin transport system substrate-specific component
VNTGNGAAIPLPSPLTLADVWRPPAARRHPLAADVFLILLGSALVALGAQLRIPLPFTPVPITGQTFAVLFTGAVLGSRRGALALLAYLAEGAAGLPVFAGGAGGAAHVLGPTGGYLLAYPLAAALTGWLAERGWDRSPARAFAVMALGSLVIFVLGVGWLSRFVGGLAPALVQGMLPFLPGDLLKNALAAALLPGGWAVVRRVHGAADGRR